VEIPNRIVQLNQVELSEHPELGLSEPSSEAEDDSIEPTLSSEIKLWALKHNTTHVSLSSLLKILRKRFPFEKLPAEARTLLQTSRKVEIVNSCGGNSYYFGIANQIRRSVQNGTIDFKLPNLSHLHESRN
jgi:hypothetical protein